MFLVVSFCNVCYFSFQEPVETKRCSSFQGLERPMGCNSRLDRCSVRMEKQWLLPLKLGGNHEYYRYFDFHSYIQLINVQYITRIFLIEPLSVRFCLVAVTQLQRRRMTRRRLSLSPWAILSLRGSKNLFACFR